jgi:hypothetical protein
MDINPSSFKHQKYEIVKELGSGGAGVVWEGNVKEIGTRYAIKFYQTTSEFEREKNMLLAVYKRCGENQKMRDMYS